MTTDRMTVYAPRPRTWIVTKERPASSPPFPGDTRTYWYAVASDGHWACLGTASAAHAYKRRMERNDADRIAGYLADGCPPHPDGAYA